MSRAQAQIADVLRAHVWYFVGNLGVPGMPDRRGYKCPCGWSTGDPDDPDFEDPHDHVAQAVLAVASDRLFGHEHVCVGDPGHFGICCCECAEYWRDPAHGCGRRA